MAFVVEDGTGSNPLANSYASLTEFSSYWTDRGFDYTVYESPVIQRALVQATTYIEQVYRNLFLGYLLLDEQPLSWPRTYAYRPGAGGYPVLVEGVPKEVKYATFEYAKRILEDVVLMPDPADYDETGATISYQFEKIGPIETKVQYLPGSAAPVKSYPAADQWLTLFLRSTGSRSIRN